MLEQARGRGGGQGALVSFRCHLEWLDIVKKLLGAANMRSLRQSCFGHLFDIGNIQFQGQLYHILIRNHLIPEIDSRLSFNINGRLHEFGPVEFGLMTGLKFSGWYEPSTASTIHSLFFTNRRSLKFIDISVAFRRECEKTGGHSLYALKLAFLFVLYAVVLPRDRKEKNIEMKYVHLADDLERFQEYPWGRVSYDYLVTATLSRRRVVDNILRQERRMAYDAFGFVLAMQTWVYEFMPDLGRDCAHTIKRNLNRFPRILRWRADEFYHYDDLLGYFTPEYANRMGIVSPSAREWEALQELGLAQRHMSPTKLIINAEVLKKRKACEGLVVAGEVKKQRVEPDSGLKERLRSARLKEKGKKVIGDSTAESKSVPVQETRTESGTEEIVTNVTNLEIDVQLKVILRKMDLLESLIRRCKCCQKNLLEVEAGDDYEDLGVGGECHGTSPTESKLVQETVRTEFVEVKDEKAEDDGLEIEKTEVLVESLKSLSMDRKKGSRSVEGVGSPIGRVGTRSSKRLSKTPVNLSSELRLFEEAGSVEGARIAEVKAGKNPGPSATKSVARELFASNKDRMYDPLEATFHPKNLIPFEVWYDAAKNLQPEPETPLPLISKPIVSVSWFDSLWGRREWLWDEHIDALTNLLMWKYKRAKDSFESGWAVMDALGTGYLLHGDFEKTWSSMSQYVNGKWPREGGLRWVEARQIIGVANVTGNHWICYAISFQSQTITIYDSQRGERNWPTIKSHFDNMSRYIPWLCANAGIWEAKKMGDDLRLVWDVVSGVEAPQQIGNHDCGIMAVKFIECLASNHDITSIDPARCGIFRRIYCAQLFEFGREFPAEPQPKRTGADGADDGEG